MTIEFCTDIDWISSHLRTALPGASCVVTGSEGVSVRALGGWPGIAGVRLSGEGFRSGDTVYVAYESRGASCGFYARVRASRAGEMLLEDPAEIMVHHRMAA
ncbi:MAG: hypothetical protein O3C46_03155 [Bacteroidetes bacterium]|nr:hypothetical protein [Bacteroidota bacterium]